MQRDSAILREHSYLGHAELRAMGGVGEMYDTLLVYENFPTGGMSAGDQLAGSGVTFRPAAVESLTHFPIVLAAHMADQRLVLMVEVIDGAIGNTTAGALGQRLLATAERLLQQWERPLRDVSVLLAGETAPLGTGAAKPLAGRSIHARFAAVAARIPDSPAVTWADGTLSYRELDDAANRLANALVARGVGAESHGGHPASSRAAVCRGDPGRAEGRRHLRAYGAGDARRAGEFDSATKRCRHCHRR